jgi:AcrR family transcriptional regulator
VRRILEAAGIKNIAAVNYYFGDKDKLYEAALRHAFCSGTNELKAPTFPPGMSAPAKLYQFIRTFARHVTVTDKNDWHTRLISREVTQPSAAGELLLRDYIRPVYQVLWGLLREVLGPDVPQERVHLLGFSIVGQCVYHRIAGKVLRRLVGDEEHDTYTPERLADHIANFSMAALGLTGIGEQGASALSVPRSEEEVPS